MMFGAAMIAILVAIGLALVRAFRGPSAYDRILAVNTLGTLTVLSIAVVGFLMGRPEFLDIALVYVLISFVATVAVLKFFEYGNLGTESRFGREPEV